MKRFDVKGELSQEPAPTKRPKTIENDYSVTSGGDILFSAGINLESERPNLDTYTLFHPKEGGSGSVSLLSPEAERKLENIASEYSLTVNCERVKGILELALQDYIAGVLNKVNALNPQETTPEGLYREDTFNPRELLRTAQIESQPRNNAFSLHDVLSVLDYPEKSSFWGRNSHR